jgi:hypothetical protein
VNPSSNARARALPSLRDPTAAGEAPPARRFLLVIPEITSCPISEI